MATEIVLANKNQDDLLRDFQRNHFSGGDLLMRVEREPSFFNSLSAEGKRTDVIVAKDKESSEILATGTLSEKKCFLNGESESKWVGYLSGLQITPKARNSTLLARGYKFISNLRKEKKSKLFLSVIVEGNNKAMSTLTSRRAGLPYYRDWGKIEILIMKNRFIYPKNYKLDPTLPLNFKVKRAEKKDLSAIIEFWRREGKNYQFFPEYSKEDILSDSGLLLGLRTQDIRIVVDHVGEIYGTLGVWNQTSFRQRYVHHYTKQLALLRPLINTVNTIKKLPKFPKKKAKINYSYFSNICIKRDNPVWAKALIHSIFSEHHKESNDDYLAVGLHESDPLLSIFKSIPHKLFANRLFVVHWEDELETHDKLRRDLVPYVELGGL